MSKSLFRSKTFWFNVVAAVAQYGYAVIPAEYAVPVVAVANVVLRWVTVGPAHLFDPK